MQGKIHAKDQQIERHELSAKSEKVMLIMQKRSGLDKVVMIVRKRISEDNDEHFDYPYYIVRVQMRRITTKR